MALMTGQTFILIEHPGDKAHREENSFIALSVLEDAGWTIGTVSVERPRICVDNLKLHPREDPTKLRLLQMFFATLVLLSAVSLTLGWVLAKFTGTMVALGLLLIMDGIIGKLYPGGIR
jgi:hypothetical protein